MLGTVVNSLAVIAGGSVGLLLKKGLSQRFSNILMNGIALCTLYIGISGSLSGENTLITIISLIVGALIGEALDLNGKVVRLGSWVEQKFKAESDEKNSIAEGFVTASLLFCVGAMTIVGSLESGLTGNHRMLFTKAALDGIVSVIFASSLGVGVVLSAAFIFVFQGAITMLAQFAAPYLSTAVIGEMTCVGSLLIIGLGLNMLKLTDLKIMNYLPAIFIPIILCVFM